MIAKFPSLLNITVHTFWFRVIEVEHIFYACTFLMKFWCKVKKWNPQHLKFSENSVHNLRKISDIFWWSPKLFVVLRHPVLPNTFLRWDMMAQRPCWHCFFKVTSMYMYNSISGPKSKLVKFEIRKTEVHIFELSNSLYMFTSLLGIIYQNKFLTKYDICKPPSREFRLASWSKIQ